MLNSPDDRIFYSKDPRALPDDAYPKLILAAVKPGKYRMTRADVSQEADFILTPKNSKEFEVIAGPVTYIGSISMFYTSRFEGRNSVRTPISFQILMPRASEASRFERILRFSKSLGHPVERHPFPARPMNYQRNKPVCLADLIVK